MQWQSMISAPGAAPLSYLTKFDIDYLKIGQVLHQQPGFSGNETQALCEAIIVMAQRGQAEGDCRRGGDEEQQRDLLKEIGLRLRPGGAICSSPADSCCTDSRTDAGGALPAA